MNVTDDDIGENGIIVLTLENADTLPFEINPSSRLLTIKEGTAILLERYSVCVDFTTVDYVI